MGDANRSGEPNLSDSGLWPPQRARARIRQKLRNGTWIIPGTGQRTRRQFTLQSPSHDGPADEESMLSVREQTTIGGTLNAMVHNVRTGALGFWSWLKSPKGQGTFKCSVAYLLASMGTFFPPFAHFLGPMDGKHIVATICVYFHPARTTGSQIEAVAIAVVAVLYAQCIGMLSMATSVLVGSVWEQVHLAYALILLVFIGGGMGFIGWVKAKLNNPLVSVGASIASIGIITIVTKENSVHSGVFTNQKIVQSLKILLMATTISTLVNIVVFPVSARKALRNSMRNASASLSEMLSMIARGFLSGAEEDFSSKGFAQASAAFRSTLTTMNKNLKESKYEYYFLGQEQIYQHDKAIARCMEKLSQSLGGLRSAANTQFELLKEKSDGTLSRGPLSPRLNVYPPISGSYPPGQLGNVSRFSVLSSIEEAPDERNEDLDEPTPLQETPGNPSTLLSGQLWTPSDIFELFITRLGPSMKSLVYTLSEILRQPPFDAPGCPITVNHQFKQSVDEALALYNYHRGEALEQVYKIIELDRSRSENVQADYEEVAAACGHFSFSLLSLGHEMHNYLNALDDLKHATERRPRSWTFLKFWKYIHFTSKSNASDPESEPLVEPVRPIRRSAMPRGIPDHMLKRRDSYGWDAEPQASQIRRAISQRVLAFLRWLSRDDIRFGLKVGIGAALYAMFAFIPETRPIYQHWRGEWGLLSFMIVCSMTVGASNTTGWARFMGTLMGATFVLANWFISGGHAVPLALLSWLVSFGTFYIMVGRGNGPFGRFILLTYNVSTLYAYSLTQQVDDDDDDEGGTNPLIQVITFHRVIAVSVGILWGLIVCRLIWPISARKKFREGLCVLYLQMGLIWKRGPLAILLRSDATDFYMKTGEQAALQRYANQLQTLRTAATSEYELRGPFPAEAYGRILSSTQRLLDAFHAMSLVTQKHGRLSDGEKALLYHTADERRELCSRICHVFQVLASSMMLEYPLTDAIPTVMGTRDKLLGKIFRFRKEHDEGWEDVEGGRPSANGNGKSSVMVGEMSKVPKMQGKVVVEEPDYALLYAYALVTSQVAKELRVVEEEIEKLFGRLDEDALLLQ